MGIGSAMGGIDALPDIREVLRSYKPRELSAAEKAFQEAHPRHTSTTFGPGYREQWEQNWQAQQGQGANPQATMNDVANTGNTANFAQIQPYNTIGDFDGRFAQAARESANRDPFQGMSGIQRQIMERMGGQQQPLQNTGQQITDPATGRNFTIGGPMTMDMDTGLAYQRAMEAFNQSNTGQLNPGATNQAPAQQFEPQRGGVAQQISQQQMDMLRSRQQLTPQQRNPYVDQGYFQGRMQQQPFMQQPMMSPYQQPFMQQPMMSPYQQPFMQQMGGYGMPQMGGYGMPQMGGYGMPQMGGYGMPQMGGYGMPQPMGGKGASGMNRPQPMGGKGAGGMNRPQPMGGKGAQ